MNLKNATTIPINFAVKGRFFRLSLWVRAFSALSVPIYVVFGYRIISLFQPYSREAFTKSFFVYLVCGLVCNLGLFFITTKWARLTTMGRVGATILYLPTFFITPIVVGYFSYSRTGIIFIFLLSVYIYYRFNPWRKT